MYTRFGICFMTSIMSLFCVCFFLFLQISIQCWNDSCTPLQFIVDEPWLLIAFTILTFYLSFLFASPSLFFIIWLARNKQTSHRTNRGYPSSTLDACIHNNHINHHVFQVDKNVLRWFMPGRNEMNAGHSVHTTDTHFRHKIVVVTVYHTNNHWIYLLQFTLINLMVCGA